MTLQEYIDWLTSIKDSKPGLAQRKIYFTRLPTDDTLNTVPIRTWQFGDAGEIYLWSVNHIADRLFTIMRVSRRDAEGHMRHDYGGPMGIPWAMIAPHEAQAQRNHDQTLQRLYERGGLCACEACAVLEDRAWRAFADHQLAEERLTQLLREWEGKLS